MTGHDPDRLVLAIDTSFGPVSGALAALDGAIVASFEADNAAGTQAETLPPRVAEMFASAGARFDRLSRIAVTVGPGAFTGVRVGLAFAKGLRLATGAAVLGFTTLECLAVQAAEVAQGSGVIAAIDAKRGEVYLQIFDDALRPLIEAQLLPLSVADEVTRKHAMRPLVLTGSGAPLLGLAKGAAKIVEVARIDAKALAKRAASADPARYPPTAAYLRAPDARLPS
jgi:tRNA threonylcarbamoyladenosine biosynthesis protein TsaB